MNNESSTEIYELASEIMRYLDKHPGTADSIDGITQWWLLRQRYLSGLSKVECALEYLISVGNVEKFQHADGTTVYRKASQRGSRSGH